MHKDVRQRTAFAVTLALLLVAALIGIAPAFTDASSHREAPLIANDPQADGTDLYAFVSPELTSSVTLIADYIPLEAPYGGPNFHRFADDVLYEIKIDNVGDARPHITYQFNFHTVIANPNTFLYNNGPINSLGSANWNVKQFYTVTEIISDSVAVTTTVLGSNLASPPVNIGSASNPNYDAVANAAIQTLSNGGDTIKVFAGQRDDPFFVDLGSIFDLLHLRGQPTPVGYPAGPGNIPLDGLAGYNVHSIAIQIPISRLTKPGDSVIGAWTTASRFANRVLAPLGSVTESGSQVQVSRLGMPLVNEVVMPLALKDAFNGLLPGQDFGLYTDPGATGQLLNRSVLTPELQTLLGALYGVPNPGKPRNDIQQIFLQGMVLAQPFTITTPGGPVVLPASTKVNRPLGSPQPAEMLRLNTAFKPGAGGVCSPTPNYAFGLLGGDACGFPNGRRLQDDVTDIELLAVAGAAWQPLTNDTSFTPNGSVLALLHDNINQNDKPFGTTFPYLASPHQGQYPAYSFVRSQWFPFVAK